MVRMFLQSIIQLLGTKGCYEATNVRLIWLKHNVYILHLTTKQIICFRTTYRYKREKKNNQVSVHHLWFSDKDYERLECLSNGIPIKKNKTKRLIKGAAWRPNWHHHHGPRHSYFGGKGKPYFQSMSGAPMVQHSLNCMLNFINKNSFHWKNSWKMCQILLSLSYDKQRIYPRRLFRRLVGDLTIANGQLLRKTCCTNVVGHHWKAPL
jgi:dihydroorotase-like cyclic amidohydrolase